MTAAEGRLYAEASRIIDIAMGATPKPGFAVPKRRADDDPLAWWCGVEAVVAVAKRFERDWRQTGKERG